MQKNCHVPCQSKQRTMRKNPDEWPPKAGLPWPSLSRIVPLIFAIYIPRLVRFPYLRCGDFAQGQNWFSKKKSKMSGSIVLKNTMVLVFCLSFWTADFYNAGTWYTCATFINATVAFLIYIRGVFYCGCDIYPLVSTMHMDTNIFAVFAINFCLLYECKATSRRVKSSQLWSVCNRYRILQWLYMPYSETCI